MTTISELKANIIDNIDSIKHLEQLQEHLEKRHRIKPGAFWKTTIFVAQALAPKLLASIEGQVVNQDFVNEYMNHLTQVQTHAKKKISEYNIQRSNK